MQRPSLPSPTAFPSRLPTLVLCPLFVVLVGLSACAPGPEGPVPAGEPAKVTAGETSASTSTGPRLATTTPGVDFLVRALLAEINEPGITIERVLPAGGDPAHGLPDAEQVLALRDVDLILAHHPDYEAWMRTASLPSSKIVWTAESLPLKAVPAKTHSHGPDGEHSHPAVEPRIQLDPSLVAQQAEIVAASLNKIAPHHAAAIAARLDTLLAELDALDARLTEHLRDLAPAAPVASDGLIYWRTRFHLGPVPDGEPIGPVLRLDTEPEMPGSVRLDPLELDREGRYDYVDRFHANLSRLADLIAALRARGGVTLGELGT